MGVLQHRLWEPRGKPTGCLAGVDLSRQEPSGGLQHHPRAIQHQQLTWANI